MLKGLEYAHGYVGHDGRPLQIVHRDVSPSNVLVSSDGQVKVSDFGLATSARLAIRLPRRPRTSTRRWWRWSSAVSAGRPLRVVVEASGRRVFDEPVELAPGEELWLRPALPAEERGREP